MNNPLYHCSPVEISAPHSKGLYGEFVFFACSPSGPGLATIVYAIDADELELIDASRLFTHTDAAKLDRLVADFARKYSVTVDDAEDLISEQTSWNSKRFEDRSDIAESFADVDWDTQRFTARAAKVLGYDGVNVIDENGGVTMIDLVANFSKMVIVKRAV